MGFNSHDQVIDRITNAAQTWFSLMYKTTGAGAYTAGRWYSFFTLNGNPIAGAFGGTALQFQQLNDASNGALWHGGNVNPMTKHLMVQSLLSAIATAVPGYALLVDLLGFYPQINLNSNAVQVLTNPVGIQRYVNGSGVMAFLEVTTALGATASNIPAGANGLLYTDNAGNAGNQSPVAVPMTASQIINGLAAAPPAFPFLPLAAGDTGIRSVQQIQFSAAMGAGVGSLVLCRPLAGIPIGQAGLATERDLVFQLPSLPQIQDGACLGILFMPGAATAAGTPFMIPQTFAWN
jgi:hypothetical protein